MKKTSTLAMTIIALVGLSLTACHKHHLPAPKPVNPLSLINGTISTPTKVYVDYSQSVSDVAGVTVIEDYSQGIFKSTKTDTATLSCAVVSFDRQIPIDTIKLWISYKKIGNPATSQQLAAYGTYEDDVVSVTAPPHTTPIVALGDSALYDGNYNYLVFGDVNGDIQWDFSLVTASEAVKLNGVNYLVVTP